MLPQNIDTMIHEVRDQEVMLDSDLATVYQVSTKAINKAVGRNVERFTDEFSFLLEQNEWDNLRFQNGTSSSAHGGRRYLPRVFTEHGSLMLASVLNSPRAIEASKEIIRAFVRLRNATKIEARQRSKGVDLGEAYKMAEALLEQRERLELAEECIDVLRPTTPIGSISRVNGRPRNQLVRAYPRTSKITIEIPSEYRHLFNYLQFSDRTSLSFDDSEE